MFQVSELFSSVISRVHISEVLGLGIFQQCNKTRYDSNVMRLGTAQQCVMTSYTSAIVQDWDHLSNVRQGIRQQGFKIGSSSAK